MQDQGRFFCAQILPTEKEARAEAKEEEHEISEEQQPALGPGLMAQNLFHSSQKQPFGNRCGTTICKSVGQPGFLYGRFSLPGYHASAVAAGGGA
jgi:hypothetical protein